MKQIEIKNMNEYNPDYHRDGTLVWKKIGERTGKHGIRKQKQYNCTDISKIIVPAGLQVAEAVLEASRRQYDETHVMIPVFLTYDFELIAGYKQYILAKELGISRIAFHRVTKMDKKEAKEFREKACNRPLGNKKYPVKDINGDKIYLTYAQHKDLNTCFKLARKCGKFVKITPDQKIRILDKDGTICKKDAKIKNALSYLAKINRKNAEGIAENGKIYRK